MHAAKNNFDDHIEQCEEALEVYRYLGKSSYEASFGLRFVWVAAISALDHYVTELIIERSVEQFANDKQLTQKLLSEATPFASAMQMHSTAPAARVVEFRNIVQSMIRFRSFQKAKDVADGLAFVWAEKHKWKKISEHLSLKEKSAKATLNNICYRRDLIVHNADYDHATGNLTPCTAEDADAAWQFIANLVGSIDVLVE